MFSVMHVTARQALSKSAVRESWFLMIICLSISMAATRTVPDDDLALVRGRLFIRCCLGVAGISEPE